MLLQQGTDSNSKWARMWDTPDSRELIQETVWSLLMNSKRKSVFAIRYHSFAGNRQRNMIDEENITLHGFYFGKLSKSSKSYMNKTLKTKSVQYPRVEKK